MFRWKNVARAPQSRPDPLLADLVDAIDRAPIIAAQIRDPAEIVFGDYDEDDFSIRIDMQALVVNTGIHELLHRVKPEWSERAVRARTTKIVVGLSDDQIAALYARLLDAMRAST